MITRPHSPSLKLGVLVSSLSRNAGGLFESVRHLSLSLQARGVSVSVFGVRDSFTANDLEQWSPLRPQVIDAHGPSSFGYAPGLSAALNNADLDVLHLHGLWTYTSVVANRWQRRTARPLFISPRGMLDRWALANSGLKKKLAHTIYEGRNLRSASVLHALNENEAKSIAEFLPGKRILVSPNAINIPSRHATATVAQEQKVALFIGRIHPKKGISELITAWAKARSEAPNIMEQWRLDIAGWDDGGHLNHLRHRVRELKLEQNVAFIGPVYGADKSARLNSASAFVLPSFSEGLPMSVLEAWGYKLPVLMTKFCNLNVGFTAMAALRIDPEPDVLAEQLVAHLSRPDLVAFGKRGFALAESNFSWPSVAAQMENAYRWAIGAVPAPAELLGSQPTGPLA